MLGRLGLVKEYSPLLLTAVTVPPVAPPVVPLIRRDPLLGVSPYRIGHDPDPASRPREGRDRSPGRRNGGRRTGPRIARPGRLDSAENTAPERAVPLPFPARSESHAHLHDA
ncbi:hypothetical protein GCM10010238_40020 [Streptomyces griseoviridis]|uniref:Uncharacterized protein n=1 Tax=Streptomyces griseoviridis TaxID=45398 RepID=A0A918GM89_STRGD|nr:hypothetical protein GCM10010238_40020 [Streptomyces niveoruber]GGS79448.1 hypothetical protein GCM10010240_10990 [Streptomyces griseoviridis]